MKPEEIDALYTNLAPKAEVRDKDLDHVFAANQPGPTIGDYAKSLAAGGVNLATQAGQGLRSAGVGIGTPIRDLAQRGEKALTESMTPGGQAALSAMPVEFNGSFDPRDWKAGATPVASTLMQTAQSAPSMIGAYFLGKPAYGALNAAKVGEKLASGLQRVGVGAGRAARIGENVESGVAFGAAEGVQAGLQNAAQSAQDVQGMKQEDLEKSPYYQRVFADTPQSLPLAERQQQAREAVSRQAENEIIARTTPVTGGIGMLTGGGVLGQVAKKQSKGIIREVLGGAGKEGLQEALQSPAEQVIQNLATRNYVNPEQNIWQGVPESAVAGALSGALLGAGGGAGHAAMTPSGGAEVAQKPPGGPLEAAAQTAHTTGATQPSFPFTSAEAAQRRANTMSSATGEAWAVGPHPQMPDRFIVSPAAEIEAAAAKAKGEKGGDSGKASATDAATSAIPATEASKTPWDAIEADQAREKETQLDQLQQDSQHAKAEFDAEVTRRMTGGEPLETAMQSAFAAIKQRESIDEAAHEAATSPLSHRPFPTEAQKKAGNYQLGHPQKIQGLNISIENPAGSVRRGTDADGKPWENVMPAHYGYIRGTEAADGHKLDVYVGPHPGRPTVFVVDQHNPKTGEFDEHKVMLGFDNATDAEAAYRAAYKPDWQGFGGMTPMPVADFKQWIKDPNNLKSPLGASHAETLRSDAGQVRSGGDGLQPSPNQGGENLQRDQEAQGTQAIEQAGGVQKEAGPAAVPTGLPEAGVGETAAVTPTAGILPPREQRIQALADRLRKINPQIPAVAAPKTVAKLIEAMDSGNYNDVLHPDNKTTRQLFTELTGVKLLPTVKATKAQFKGVPFAGKVETTPAPAETKAETPAAEVAPTPKAPDRRQAGEREGAPDRRQDTERRKRVTDMSVEEMRRALLTDPLTGLGNRRAYEEAPKLKHQASIDVDSLKWVNDHLGHAAGDEMLRIVGEALAAETDQAFHVSGDEFVAQHDDEVVLRAQLDAARARLAEAKIEAIKPDGGIITLKGVAYSYGTGTDLKTAEHGLHRQKLEREAAGERAARGETPRGATETPQPAVGHPAEDYPAAKEPQKAVVAPETPPLSNQAAASASERVAQWVKDELETSRSIGAPALFKQANDAFGGTQAEGKYTPKDAYDALELGVNQYIGVRTTLYSPRVPAGVAKLTIGQLNGLLQRLPTQTKRTGETDEFQQFSTPPTYAFLANWVANVQHGETYVEPSAGIGGLAVFGKIAGAKVVVNELSPRRAAVLKAMDFAQTFSENAEQLNNVLPDAIKPTVIVMNPPFSATAGRMPGARETMNGARHIEQALKRLEPNGRLVAIVGEGMAADRPAFRDWWRKIQAEYSVRANIGIEGKGYAKYGTTFDNQLLVIDKTGPTTGAVVTDKVAAPADALPLLEVIRNERILPSRLAAAEPAPSESPGTAIAAGNRLEGGRGPEPAPSGPPAAVGGGTGTGGSAGRPDAGRVERPQQANAGGKGGPSLPADNAAGRHGQSGQPIPPASNLAASRSPEPNQPSPLDSPRVAVEAAEAAPKSDLDESTFEAYRPQRLSIPGAKPHPGKLVQSAAMAAVEPPAATYQPNLPKTVVTEGKLSLAQIEAVVYAGQAFQQILPDGSRRGFFIGDGTGVGKGREIAGIILDNLRSGQSKAVWMSEKQGLMKDAKRDFAGIGGDPDLIFNHNNAAKYGEPIKASKGILFTTYATLRVDKAASAQKKGVLEAAPSGASRLQQIVDWLGKDFDGVIVFDEAHNAGNAIAIKSDRGTSEASAQALKVIDLQNALPQARILYVSATGATEVSNLSYAKRLGLWGENTAFPSTVNFIGQIEKGGLASMELVARDMKQMGMYLARSLSYDGVSYSKLEHTLTPLQTDIYNEIARAWQGVLKNINAALKMNDAHKDAKAKGAALAAFWGAQQRFFNQVLTAMQMPAVIAQMHADLKAGHAVVLQLVNTNEAAQNRQLAARASEAAEKGDADPLEDLDLTPREQLMQYVQNSFPIAQYEEYIDDSGNVRSQPAVDANGNPVINKDAVALRDKLLENLREIRVPDGPLEIILNEFGHDKVAEVTGRGKRVVRERDDKGNQKLVVQTRGRAAVHNEAEAFQNDKRQILVFSDAGGTGFSFQSDLGRANQRRRMHYLIQPGWRADKAVQGFGRTHRTNQANAPHYYLPTTNLPAQKRFVSSIARRLDQLGALTKGQREATNQGLFSAKDNLEGPYANTAISGFFNDLYRNRIPGMTFTEVADQLGFDNLIDKRTGALNVSKLPSVPQFLNRLLSLDTVMQETVFAQFGNRMDALIDNAIANGTLETGMQTLRAKEVHKISDQPVYTDAKTGAVTRYVELELKHDTVLKSFASFAARVKRFDGQWVRNTTSGKVWAQIPNRTTTTAAGDVLKAFIFEGTTSSRNVTEDKIGENFAVIDAAEAERLWEAENAARPQTYSEHQHMIVGSVLPIWDRLGGHIAVARTQTVDGERILGRLIHPDSLKDTLQKLGASSSALAQMTPAKIMQAVLGANQVARLANDWTLFRARVSGENRIEIGNVSTYDQGQARELQRLGAIAERISWNNRYFIPTGEAGESLLAKLLETKPLAGLEKRGGASEDDSGTESSLSSRVLGQPQDVADKSFSQFTKLVDAVKHVASKGDPFYSELAKKITPSLLNATFKVVEVGVPVPGGVPRALHSAHGVQLTDKARNLDGVWVKGSSFGEEQGINDRTVMHEALHQATARKIQFGNMKVSQGSPLQVAVTDLYQLANHVIAEYKKTTPSEDLRKVAAAALNDPRELISHGLTTPVVQQFLKTIPGVQKRSAWGEFVDAIRRILGLDKTHTSALADLIEITERIIDSEIPAGARELENQLVSQGLAQVITRHSPREAFNTLREGTQQWLSNASSNDRSISPLMRSINTQYHKAETLAAQGKPEFKQVFDLGQRFLSDTTLLAAQAAQLAPNILHQPRSLTDFSGGAKELDLQAIDKALNEGTLYGGGAPLAGVRWSDEQLRKRYQLTDTQIRLYREYLDATAESVDIMAKAQIAAHAKQNEVSFERDLSLDDMAALVVERLDDALTDAHLQLEYATDKNRINDEAADLADMDKPHEAEQLRRDAERMATEAEGKIDRLEKTIADVKAINERANALRQAGYKPLMRFGEHTVTARDATGQVAFYGMYEGTSLAPRAGQVQANQVAAALRAENPDWKVETGVLSKEAYKLYAGINLEALQLFADHMDAAAKAPYQEYLRQAVNNRSAMKRMIHRQGTPGFSPDARRTLAQFVLSNGRLAASQYNLTDMRKAAEAIPNAQGDIKDEAVKLHEYLTQPKEEAARFRGFLFFNYLGGSIASAMVNLTQVPAVTAPYLTQHTSYANAVKELVAAAKLAFQDPAKMTGDLGDALRKAEADGVTAPQEIFQLMALASNSVFAGAKVARFAMQAWGKLFATAEQFNRRTTFIAAYRIAIEQGKSREAAFAFAETAVNDTQFIYNRGNRPNWARGAAGSVLFTFKQFNIAYLELFKRMSPKQRAVMLGTFLVFAGAGGLPFEEDIEDLVDTLGQWLGFATNAKRTVRNAAKAILGETGGDVLMRGVSAGLPFDIAGRMGMANLVPGSAILKPSEVDKTRDVAEALGPLGSLVQSTGDALASLATGHFERAALDLMPTAVRNAYMGGKMFTKGYAEDMSGRRTLDVTPVEGIAKTLGFQPGTLAQFSEIKQGLQESRNLMTVKQNEINTLWSEAILSHDQDGIDAAKRKLITWNHANPDMPLRFDPAAIRKRVIEAQMAGDLRYLRGLPKGMRAGAKQELGL